MASPERPRRPRRKEFVGGYTSHKELSELNLPVVRGPGAGGKRLDLDSSRDKKKE